MNRTIVNVTIDTNSPVIITGSAQLIPISNIEILLSAPLSTYPICVKGDVILNGTLVIRITDDKRTVPIMQVDGVIIGNFATIAVRTPKCNQATGRITKDSASHTLAVMIDTSACRHSLALKLVPLYVVLAVLCFGAVLAVLLHRHIQKRKLEVTNSYVEMN